MKNKDYPKELKQFISTDLDKIKPQFDKEYIWSNIEATIKKEPKRINLRLKPSLAIALSSLLLIFFSITSYQNYQINSATTYLKETFNFNTTSDELSYILTDNETLISRVLK